MSESTPPNEGYNIDHYTPYAGHVAAGFHEHEIVVVPPLLPKTSPVPNPLAETGFSDVHGGGYATPADAAQASFVAARRVVHTLKYKPGNVGLALYPPPFAEAAGYTPGPTLFAFMVRDPSHPKAA